MNVNLKDNLMFFHIPKNAGKSIISGFGLEKNRQLNQFSLLFYKKLKQNSKINEY